MSLLSLQQISTGTSIANYVRPNKLNILVADCSGSMSWSMSQLATDVISRIDQLPPGDALLLGIFSSVGWFRWIIARELTDVSDYHHCHAIVKEEFRARATTCFSEILADAPKAINPFLAKFPVVVFTLFSDGCPVVPSLQREDAAIESAAKTLAPLLTAGSILSYGDYADRKRLSRLAQLLGVEFIATDNIKDIGETFERTAKKRSARRKKVKLAPKTTFAFSFTSDGTVNTLDPQQSEVLVDEQAAVYALNGRHDDSGDMKLVTTLDVQYAAALALLSDGRIDDALSFLSIIGDVALVEALGSALTNTEIARAEQMIRDAITDETKRFTRGQRPNCLPQDDAFDLLDCLDLLMNDAECKFYPTHPDFKYKKIGRVSKTQPGYPKFIAEENIGVSITSLTGHQSELNLSVLVRIPGSITLPDTIKTGNGTELSREAIGLPQQFLTYVFRNYSLIANALPTVTKLPIGVNSGTIGQILIDRQLIAVLPNDGEIVTLDLSKIPVCNKKRGTESADWQRMADLAYESLKIGSYLKVLKAKRDALDPQRESEQRLDYTPEQLDFLSACGIDRKGAYAPPSIQEEPTDVMDVYRMEVKIDKGSAVSMKDFQLMIDGKKKFNFVGELMKQEYDLLVNDLPKHKGPALEWLKVEIDTYTKIKRTLDNELNARRFSAALTGAWARSFKEDTVEILTGPKKDHKAFLSFGTIQKKI